MTWIVPEAQRVATKKAYFPPDSRIMPLECVVIHYTAGAGPLKPRVKAWAENPEVDSSTHLVISRTPQLEPTLQLAPLTARTWHAGQSAYKGKAGVNKFSLGLDLDNVGFLTKAGAGFVTWASRPYAGPAPFVDSSGRAWEPYTEEAILELCRCVLMLVDLFPILANAPERLTGHENVKRGKSDPGRAFDPFWPIVRNVCNGVFPTGLTEV